MSTTPHAQRPGGRNIAPIRWPRPELHTLLALAVWVVGVLVGVLLPALVVPPSSTTASTGEVWLAFSCTVVGVLVMLAVGAHLYRRFHERGLLVFTVVPSGTVLLGGFMFLGLKLFG